MTLDSSPGPVLDQGRTPAGTVDHERLRERRDSLTAELARARTSAHRLEGAIALLDELLASAEEEQPHG